MIPTAARRTAARRLLPALVAGGVLLAGVAAAGCGSSGSAPASSSSTSTTASGGTSTTASGDNGSGSGTSATGQLPAVSNPTDLKAEPVPSAGTPPAPTRLLTRDLVVGTGATAAATNTVQVQYVGANYADGKVFDASWTRGSPASFPLNGVIPGFEQAIVGMKVGGRREVVIPPDLGYGAQGSPPAVGPNETLVFVIDLLSVQ